MPLRRLPPLAIALALVAAALVATVIATRHSVNDAFATVGDGQAIAEELDARADLSDLDGPPTSAQLDTILASHRDEGVRYLALVDSRANVIAESGTPRGTLVPRTRPTRADRPRGGREDRVEHVAGRLRVESPYGRRSWGRDGRATWLVLEIEPSEANELRTAADRSILIGLIAADKQNNDTNTHKQRELRR